MSLPSLLHVSWILFFPFWLVFCKRLDEVSLNRCFENLFSCQRSMGDSSKHNGGAISQRRTVRGRILVLGRNICVAGMVILAHHMLCLAPQPVHLLQKYPVPAETREQGSGGTSRKESFGQCINANSLMHSSKFFKQGDQAEGAQNHHSRAHSSLLFVQKRGEQGNANQGHGGTRSACARGHGAKTGNGKTERELDRIFGRCLGKKMEQRTNFVKREAMNPRMRAAKLDEEEADGNHAQVAEHDGAELTGMKLACRLAASKRSMKSAVDKLKANFWAPSSKASRDVKRSEVMRLAKLVAGANMQIFPLSQDVVEGVAACLKDANMKSGDQYLNELKLCHVERGFDLPPWLIRTLAMCKKALIRNKGPVKRALESKVENIKEDTWTLAGTSADNGINPALAYSWACLWMLREIEASECKWEHVQVNSQRKTVSLTIPISKMDQDARGIKRTLQCCGESVCSRFCVWNVWNRIQTEFPRKRPKRGHIFTDKFKGKLSKRKMIESWRKATHTQVTGHSARRSGAMEHVRRGMQLQELAFLGRWKSAVVLTYANDALQEVPTNRPGPSEVPGSNGTITPSPWTSHCAPGTPMWRTPRTPMCHAQDEGETEREQNNKNPPDQTLWVSSCEKRQGRRVWHKVTNAGWQISMAKWNTACGWNFTKNPEKVLMSVTLQFNQTRCRKCLEVLKSRDKVMEGKRLAGFITNRAAAWFNPMNSRDNEQGQIDLTSTPSRKR